MSEPGSVILSNEKPEADLRGGLFRAGGTPGPGRPKGATSASKEVKAAARALVEDPDYREMLKLRLRAGEAPHMETLLWHYAYGKPKDTIEVKTVDEFNDLTAAELQARSMAIATKIAHVVAAPEEQDSLH